MTPTRRDLRAYSGIDSRALESLAACLRALYQHRDDLRSFLVYAGVPETILLRVAWAWTSTGDYRRDLAGGVLQELLFESKAHRRDAYRAGAKALERILDAVAEQRDSLGHLGELYDGPARIAEARLALQELERALGRDEMARRAERARLTGHTEARRLQAIRRGRQSALGPSRERLAKLGLMSNPRRRSLQLERELCHLFALHDLEPRGSFACRGEQTDGSIALDGKILLVEAKWTKRPADPKPIRNFRSKLQNKHASAFGLLISVAGFTAQAVTQAASGGRSPLVLMDGIDLDLILGGHLDLVAALRRKLRHAAETGRAMYRLPGGQSFRTGRLFSEPRQLQHS